MKRSAIFRCVLVFFSVISTAAALPNGYEEVHKEPIERVLTRSLQELHLKKLSVEDFADIVVELIGEGESVSPALLRLRFEDEKVVNALGARLSAVASQTLSVKSSVNVLGIKRFASSVLGRQHVDFRKINDLLYLIEKFESLEARGRVIEAASVLEQVTTDSAKSVLLSRIKALLKKTALKNIQGERPTLSLRQLAEIPVGSRTGDVLVVARDALRKAVSLIEEKPLKLSYWPFGVESVQSLLVQVLAWDPASKGNLISLYEWHILELLSLKKGEEARNEFGVLLTHRPDPNESNHKLRVEMAIAARGSDANKFAAEQLDELRRWRAVKFGEKCRLLFAGYYGEVFIVIGYVLIGVAGVAFLFLVVLPSSRQMILEATDSAGQSKSRRLQGGFRRGFDGEDEYSRLLYLLDLDDTATEGEIKAAYRKKAKEYHPDAQTGGGGDYSKEFVELKNAYDRLFEMRSSFFGSPPKKK